MNESRWDVAPVKSRSSSGWLAAALIGFTIGLVPGIVKITQMRHETEAAAASTAKEVSELRQSVEKQTEIVALYHHMMSGDGTKTILMDRNHPYGKYVSPAAVLPPGYVPGPVWIIPRRVVPQTMDGTLNGAYAYQLPDGTLDGWYSTGGIR
jgi:hypothetical protein